MIDIMVVFNFSWFQTVLWWTSLHMYLCTLPRSVSVISKEWTFKVLIHLEVDFLKRNCKWILGSWCQFMLIPTMHKRKWIYFVFFLLMPIIFYLLICVSVIDYNWYGIVSNYSSLIANEVTIILISSMNCPFL